jgi:hypothetical protein
LVLYFPHTFYFTFLSLLLHSLLVFYFTFTFSFF